MRRNGGRIGAAAAPAVVRGYAGGREGERERGERGEGGERERGREGERERGREEERKRGREEEEVIRTKRGEEHVVEQNN